MSRRSGRIISATNAAKNFGALIDRVRSEHAEYVVERGGAPVVRISPVGPHRCSVADLVGLLKAIAKPGEAYLKAVEAGIGKLNKPAVPEDRWAR